MSGIGATVYDSGAVRLEFGPEVSEELKQRAVKWAQKRGLKPVEASMAKSDGSRQSITFGKKVERSYGQVVAQFNFDS